MRKETVKEIFKEIMSEHPKFMEGLSSEGAMRKINLWFSALQDWTDEEVCEAVTAVLSTSRFEPKLADVVGRLKEKERAGKPTANDRWNTLVLILNMRGMTDAHELLRDCNAGYDMWDEAAGKYRKVTGEDVQRALDLIWNIVDEPVKRYLGNEWRLIDLYEMDAKALDFERNRFVKAIEDIERREEVLNAPPALPENLRRAIGGGDDEKKLGGGDESGK